MTCLIKEDGNIVVNSNTYITTDEAETLLANIGESYNLSNQELETNLLKAMRFLESKRDQYQGAKVSSEQSLQWPRSGVYIDGYSISNTTIPNDLKMAQAVAAFLISEDYELEIESDGRNIIQETIASAISVTYSDNGSDGSNIKIPLLDGYLKSLLKSSRKFVYRG